MDGPHMLTRVLDEIERSDGAIDLRTLGRRLEIEPGVLEGMIQFWVRKGRLIDHRSAPAESADCPPCGPACGGGATCPFVVALPRTVAAKPNDTGVDD